WGQRRLRTIHELTGYRLSSSSRYSTTNMKMASSVALLGLVLLGCLSDITSPLSQASCNAYMSGMSGKTMTIACPRNYDPVCGTNGRTYPNECTLCRDFFLNRALDKKHDGRCVKIDCTGHLKPGSGLTMPCTQEYSPICGTNGITYRNKCLFCRAVASGLEVNLQNYGQCFQQHQFIDCTQQKGSNICTSEYNPICGSDGRTYGNRCQFCNAPQPWNSVLPPPGRVLSTGAGPFIMTFPLQILQSNTLFLAPSTVTHWSLL
ncbi:IOVO protein, partial [Neopipo cinnamomea]|nr:IOVO protein [Neopipo cinnamomea]